MKSSFKRDLKKKMASKLNYGEENALYLSTEKCSAIIAKSSLEEKYLKYCY